LPLPLMCSNNVKIEISGMIVKVRAGERATAKAEETPPSMQ